MKTVQDLRIILEKIDGRGYKAYREIEGPYDFGDFSLRIDHAQSDPFASPSRMRVRISRESAGFPPAFSQGRSRTTGVCDYLTRAFGHECRRFTPDKSGSGNSGRFYIESPTQEILVRTSVCADEEGFEVRFTGGLPAYGRRIAGKKAKKMLIEILPEIVRRSLFFTSLDEKTLRSHIETCEDADVLRGLLRPSGLVAFVADGSLLPRTSGVDERPSQTSFVVPFSSPSAFSCSFSLPNRGEISGMGIQKGVTLIVGGGYHGKSTLLNAIERGIYNHIPGDGREFVVTDPLAVKIRAEDRRRIEKVDISPFISTLPFGLETEMFSSEDASGSTSQAANIIESIEAGASLLLIDEDTSATNFMIRDQRMQKLVEKDKEPITPFIDRVRQLHDLNDISTILVIGGSGDYFDVADCVICMNLYSPEDCTQKARDIALLCPTQRLIEGEPCFGHFRKRIPISASISPKKGSRGVKITVKSRETIQFGLSTIDLSFVEQIVETAQTRAIGDGVWYATGFMDGKRTLDEVIRLVMDTIDAEGLDVMGRYPSGGYALFRGIELAAAINRLRTLKIL